MIGYVLTLAMLWAVAPQLWNKWGFRSCVLVSLGANVVLRLLSRARRRSASGRWAAKGQRVRLLILWGLYQLAEAATASAISSLTLCDSDVTEDEKQVVALWAAFLLLHLGGPDNLTAYAQEDNKLSTRKWFEMIGHFVGVGYAIYKYTYHGGGGGGSRVLFAASVVVSGAGVIRYLERAYALSKANLDKMQEDASSSEGSSSKKKREDCHRCHSIDGKMDQLRYRIGKLQWKLCDREALLLAQDLFPIWRHAMVDSSVILPDSGRHLASEEILRLEWGSMCKVAEMELSLMYEVLYTKAIVAHSFKGWYYLTRFLSPLCTAAAALLFWLHRQHQQQGKIRGSFVGITYALLLIDFLLDLAWLLRALGSTWAYAYMQTQAPAWLRHQVICPGSWHYLHHLVVRVDPMSWLLCRDPINYRTWSGTIGQYNLLRECTTTRHSLWPDWLETKEMLYLSELHGKVKELLFQRVQAILLEAIETDDHDTAECYSMEDIRSKWGEKAFDLRNPEGRRIDLFPELDIHDVVAPKFGKEFEEDVLVWHIATCMVLQYIRQRQRRSDVRGPPLVLPARSEDHATAIAVMSEYMMFLVAVRRDMLPGLVLHSLFKVTRETLVDIWNEHKHTPLLRPEDNRKAPTNEEKLGLILRRMKVEGEEEGSIKIEGTEGTELLWDAVTLFRSLMLAGDTPADRVRRENAIESRVTVRRRRRVPVPELLEFIFNVWVDKLVYASVRCSRESHANQLSAGGGLTTVLWMVIQHAGPFRFRTAELRPIYFDIPRPGAPPPSQSQPPPPPKSRPPPPPPPPKSKPPPPPKSQPPPPPPPPVPVSPAPPPMTWPWPWPWPSVPVPTPPAHSPPAPPDQDEDEDEDSDDEDTEQYNRPIEYITLY